MLINKGGLAGDTFVLHSTYDGGLTWTDAGIELPSSGLASTSDGYIDNDVLYATYSGRASDIRFAIVRYDSLPKTWSIVKTETAYASPTALAITPALAADAVGRLWLAFTNQDRASSSFRSMGIVFTVHADIFWAERLDRWTLTAKWPRARIFTKANPITEDPHGSHCSVVTDANSNWHMTSVDDGNVVHSRYLVSEKAWESRKITSGNTQAVYTQVQVALGNVVVITNALTDLSVLQSSDGGELFVNTHQLAHSLPTGRPTTRGRASRCRRGHRARFRCRSSMSMARRSASCCLPCRS